jgi:hypothetical protein
MVICPNCVHQFHAIPVDVQGDLSALRAENERLVADIRKVNQEANRLFERWEVAESALAAAPEAEPAVTYGPEKQNYPGGPVYREGVSTGAVPPSQSGAQESVMVPREDLELAVDYFQERNAGYWEVVERWRAILLAAASKAGEGK